MPERTTTADPHVQQDPRSKGPQPPFEGQRTQTEGHEGEMEPKADHGEKSYKGLGRLQGRVALITGGDSGIGRAVAIAFAREGADVAIAYRRHDADAEETRKWVEEAGRRCRAVKGDIGSEEFCRKLVDQVHGELGRIDILVNNAAHQATYESLEEIPVEDIEYTFRTNILSMFYLCQAALPKMRPGSTVINTASIQAYDPTPELLPYATTKGAIVTFTKGLAKWAASRGIRVNCVAPGPVWTPLIPSTMPEEKVKNFGGNTPLGRPGQPAELAPPFVFLASEESSYVNGEILGVTGGRPLA